MRRSRLHVTGASGSGTTTLARAVADTWAVPHGDADDYFWMPTDPPYVDKRPDTERLRRIEARERVRREGGPVDEAALNAFLTWAHGYDDPSFSGRSRARHEEWLARLTCPILRLDSSLSREELRDEVFAWVPISS